MRHSQAGSVIATREPTTAARLRLLLACAHYRLREAMRAFLAEEGIEVIEAASSEGVLEAVAAGPPVDVALMDFQVGSVNGLETAKELRVVAPGVRVILMSVSDGDLIRDMANRAGAAVVTHGCKPSALLDEVVRVRPQDADGAVPRATRTADIVAGPAPRASAGAASCACSWASRGRRGEP